MKNLVKTTAGLALALGCLWGSLQGVWIAMERGLIGLASPTVALFAVKSRVNASVADTAIALLLLLIAYLAIRTVMTLLRWPARSADVGAAVWTAVLPLTAFVGYTFNKSDWYPDFWSAAGVTANVSLTCAAAALGTGLWGLLGAMRDRLDRPFALVGRALGLRTVMLLAVYIVLVNGVFYAANARSSAAARADSDKPPRVVVLALDGVSFEILDPLLKRGRLPNFKRLMDQGTYEPLETIQPTLSPIIWTTVATGKPMSEHGITGFTVQEPGPDQGKLVTSGMRRSKALWNILSEQNRSVGVIGWFVTWPAEPVNGFVVSSYAGQGRINKGRMDTDVPGLVYPESLLGDIEPAVERAEGELEEQFRRVFPRIRMDRLSESQKSVVEDTREVLLADLMNAATGMDLLRKESPDFFAVYLAGIDVTGHRFWKYRQPEALPYAIEQEDIEMFSDAIDNYVVLIDELIGRFLPLFDEKTLVIVMSDHGMGPHMPADGDDDRLSGHHHDSPPGILILSGAHVAHGPLGVRASVFDIAPTVLHASGLPLAQDMIGLPLLAAFDEPFRLRHTPEYIRTYESAGAEGPAAPVSESDLDKDLKDRLKSLGYL